MLQTVTKQSMFRCMATVLLVIILTLLWESLKDVNNACGKNVNILNLKQVMQMMSVSVV